MPRIFDNIAQQMLRNPLIDAKEAELRRVRERHFTARTPATKARCREQDAKLRAEISELLRADGFPRETTEKLANWNPYDQNASADFFDPEWMFGIRDGFHITIGNPPYVRADEQSDWNKAQREQILASSQYETLWEEWDLFVPFIERAYKLLQPGGVTTLIVSDAYCHSKYAQKSQNWFLQNARILRLDFCSNIKIFEAAVHNLIYLFQKADGSNNVPQRRLYTGQFGNVTLLPSDEQSKLTCRAFFPQDTVANQFNAPTVTLDRICYISVGMVLHADEKTCLGELELDDLVSQTRDAKHPKPFIEGKYLDRWLPVKRRWLEWGTKPAPDKFRRPTFPALYEVAEKLISVDMAAGVSQLKVAYDNRQLYHNHSAWSFVPWHMLAGVRNNSLKKAARIGARSRHTAAAAKAPEDWRSPKAPAPSPRRADRIPAAQRADAAADVTAWEREIASQPRRVFPQLSTVAGATSGDERVYRLSGLTPEEIRIVEEGVK